jgi:hypothetical protein
MVCGMHHKVSSYLQPLLTTVTQGHSPKVCLHLHQCLQLVMTEAARTGALRELERAQQKVRPRVGPLGASDRRRIASK